MMDLSLRAGLTLRLDGGRLQFGENVVVNETKTRVRGQLAPVAFEPQACVPAETVQYEMFNGVAARADAARLNPSRVQYELTLMHAQPLGRELPKTLGHIHDTPRAGAPTYAEMFEVLAGTAHFLFYTLDVEKPSAPFCGWIEAHAGEQILMPPNLYHLTINAGGAPLLFADLISKRTRALYDDVRATRGAPYFERTDGMWHRNPAFDEIAPLAIVPQLRVNASKSLYTQFAHDPHAFDWLDDPDRFWQTFPALESLLK